MADFYTREKLLSEVRELRICIIDEDFQEAKKRAGRISRMCEKLASTEEEYLFDARVSESELEASLSVLTANYNVGGHLDEVPWK